MHGISLQLNIEACLLNRASQAFLRFKVPWLKTQRLEKGALLQAASEPNRQVFPKAGFSFSTITLLQLGRAKTAQDLSSFRAASSGQEVVEGLIDIGKPFQKAFIDLANAIACWLSAPL